jgi:threonine dehydrogenase-like Zn-dependent dehydrogenase
MVTSGKLSKEASQVMRIPHMKGDFFSQFTYGYSLVGEVMEGPGKIIGKQVHLLHPHQEMAFVQTSQVTVIPEGLLPNVATLASNMETAVNANWDAEINIGDHVLIIGYGVIGALVASLVIKYPGVKLTILELDDLRAAKARDYGFSVVRSADEIDSEFDIAFNASASESGLQVAIDKTVTDGRIVELSWYGSKKVSLDLGNAFHHGRKRIISSQVGRIPANKQSNWSFEKRKMLVFNLLKQPEMIELLKNEILFSETPDFYKKLRNKEINEFSTVINYSS